MAEMAEKNQDFTLLTKLNAYGRSVVEKKRVRSSNKNIGEPARECQETTITQ